ncbi:MAG: hypothetical protein M3T49_08820 [Candidatus Eremiobacteraeota bacterium]|nr:hypothetical protein [Candidatus Eremiobacteraeota bacterium]
MRRTGYLDFPPPGTLTVPSVAVIAGKETVLADDVLQALIADAVSDESIRALNVDVVDMRSGDDPRIVAEKIAALPFLAQRRVVVVRGSIDGKKDERDGLLEVCAAVPAHAVLIIVHAGKPIRPQGRRPMDEAQQFAQAAPDGELIDCNLDAKACAAYIDRHAKSLGVSIEPAARSQLAACEDAAEIRNVLDRLALTVANKTIRRADVAEHAVAPEDAKLWEVSDAVNRSDARRALDLVEEMSNKMGPLIVLANEASVMWELASGTSPNAYAAKTGQNAWRLSKMQPVARSFSPEEARRRSTFTMRALERSLNGEREADQQLEELIVRLCTMKPSIRSRSSRAT